jgi:hypothetical protein
MKTYRKYLSSLAFSLFLLTGFAFSAKSQELSIQVSPSSLEMEIGDQAQLSAQVMDPDGNMVSGREIVYYSSNRRSLSVVDSTGLLTAHKHGTFRIIVISPNEESGFVRKDIDIIINPAPIARVEISEVPDKMYANTTIPLEIKVFDKAGFERTDVSVSVSSNNEKVASVGSFHRVTAIAKGKTSITASTEGIEGKININVVDNPIVKIEMSSNMLEGRTGDVFTLEAKALDKNGNEITDAPVYFAFQGESYDVSSSPSGLITQDGKFVADEPGLYTLTASVGPAAAAITVNAEVRDVQRKIELIGQGSVNDRHTSDFWIWEGVDGRDYAVTGTWGADGTAFFWDVTDPGNIIKIDSIQVDARTVNDVKISEDGKICIISREGASNRKNGMVILNVEDPRDVKLISTFTEKLTGGVHNLYIYQDPANPNIVGEFELGTPGHSIHDVWIEDGIAFSSNWSDGVQLVDVGNGIAGGSPENPVQFASYAYPSGANHAAFPYKDPVTGKFYVIAGDEIFPYGLDPDGRKPGRAGGFLHVIDFSDFENPKEVAWFKVPLAGSHNYWIEDDILYAAFYNGGVRVIDLSGELLGDMNRQGREIAWIIPDDPDGYVPNAPFTWGAQPHKGHIFYSDWNSGLWAAKLEPVKPKDAKVESR